MKPLTTTLIVSSIAILFVLWNRRYIFGSSKPSASSSKSKRSGRSVGKVASTSLNVSAEEEDEEDETTILLSGILSLNRAAHVLSRSTVLLEKLLKMDKKAACDTVLRDYDLSSLMVLMKHEDAVHEEGFKKMKEVKKASKRKELSISKPPSEGDIETVESGDHGHSTTDPLRIALYCKNLFKPPTIGRVVRLVESATRDEDKGTDQYIIELIK